MSWRIYVHEEDEDGVYNTVFNAEGDADIDAIIGDLAIFSIRARAFDRVNDLQLVLPTPE